MSVKQTQSEAEAASVPTFYSNNFIVSVTPSGARIAFGEQWEEGRTNFRSAIYLDTADALELADLIQRLTKQISLSVENSVQKNTVSSAAITRDG